MANSEGVTQDAISTIPAKDSKDERDLASRHQSWSQLRAVRLPSAPPRGLGEGASDLARDVICFGLGVGLTKAQWREVCRSAAEHAGETAIWELLGEEGR